MKHIKIIGLTGGIGAGKSKILAYIQNKYNALVIQADQIGHLVMEPGQDGYQKILEIFGTDILHEDGKINRELLGKIVFADADKLSQLNAIIHPAVKRWIVDRIEKEQKEQRYDYILIEAALLIEDHYEEICDELWYLHAREDVRHARLKKSRGYSDEKIAGIMANQQKEEVFRSHCKVVIENNGDLEDTYCQIDEQF